MPNNDQMVFTNKTLQRFKQIAIRAEQECGLFVYGPKQVKALLARLEAAERVARWFNHIKTEDPNCEPFKDFEKWKKAAGKSPVVRD